MRRLVPVMETKPTTNEKQTNKQTTTTTTTNVDQNYFGITLIDIIILVICVFCSV